MSPHPTWPSDLCPRVIPTGQHHLPIPTAVPIGGVFLSVPAQVDQWAGYGSESFYPDVDKWVASSDVSCLGKDFDTKAEPTKARAAFQAELLPRGRCGGHRLGRIIVSEDDKVWMWCKH